MSGKRERGKAEEAFVHEWCEKRLFWGLKRRNLPSFEDYLEDKFNFQFLLLIFLLNFSHLVNTFLIVFHFPLNFIFVHRQTNNQQQQWKFLDSVCRSTQNWANALAQTLQNHKQKWTTPTGCCFLGGFLSNSLAIGEYESNCNFRSSWIF